MLAYASHTGTRTTLTALRAAGWRLLLSATGRHSLRGADGFLYGLDNGAWTAFQQKRPFDVQKFEAALDYWGGGADWVVAPDIVEGGPASLEMSLKWLARVQSATERALLAVQDGITGGDVWPWLGPRCGIFVGGSTDWKLRYMPYWGWLGKQRGCWVHVGRVNTVKRIRLCAAAEVHSFDGTSVTKFPKNLPRLDRAVKEVSRQRQYEMGGDSWAM